MPIEDNTSELVVVDVSKYKKIKRRLRESEERYRILFENIPLGVYRTTPNGQVLDANPAFIRMLGYRTFEEFAEKNLNEESQELKYPREEILRILETAGELRGFEVQMVRKDGSTIYIRENAEVFRDETGKVLYYEGTIEDITEKRNMEELVAKRSRELEVLNRILISGNKAATLQHLLEIMSDYIVEMLKFDIVCIFLLDRAQETAVLNVSRGLPPAAIRQVQSFPIIAPPYRDVFIHGKSIYADEYFFNLMGPKFPHRPGWMGMAVIPLLSGDRVIGSLHVASHSHREFLADDRAILELIGKEAGVLISKFLAESAMRESEEFYRTLVETSPDIIILVNLNDEILMANRQFLQIAGFKLEEDVRGRNVLDFIPPEEHARFRNTWADLLKKNHIATAEFNLVSSNRRLIPIEISASVIIDAEGQARQLIVFARDVSARKLAERELKENEQIFRRTFEAIPDPAYVFLRQSDGKIVLHLANNAARQFSKNRIQDYLGLELEEIYLDHPQIVSHVKEAFSSGKILSEVMLFKERESEVERWLMADYVKTSENNLLWITKDITERKMSEEKVLDYQEQLRSLTSALTLAEERERRKIAVSLHDHIGQQLAFCKMKLEGTVGAKGGSLQQNKDLDEIRQLLEQIIEDTRSLIFELSPPILYELGFDAAVEWLVENIQKRFNLGLTVKVDSRAGQLEEDMQIILFQIVRELFVNVAKHSQAKNAWISVKRDKTYIQMEVGDDGRGFDTDPMLPQRKFDSSGFGFFSIRERLKHLGGVFRVESREKEGTKVFLKLPLRYNRPI